MQTLITVLTAVLGEDHDIVQRLSAAKAPTEATDYSFTDADGETRTFSEAENAALDLLADLTDDDLRAAYTAIKDAATEADPAELAELVEHGKGLRFVLDARASLDAAAEAQRENALADLADLDEPAAEADTDDPAEAEADVPTDEPEVDVPVAEDAEPEPVTAAIDPPKITRMARRTPRPAKPAPTEESLVASVENKRFMLLDGSASARHDRGDLLTLEEVTEVVIDRGRQMEAGASLGTKESYRVAGRKWEMPEERTLDGNHEENERKIEAGVQNLVNGFRNQDEALMASVCAMPTPLYDIPVIGTTERPVKGFLPSYAATRGGIIFRPGLSLTGAGSVNNSDSGVTGSWSDGDSNKVVLSVACPSTETVTVEAIVARAEVSNMQGRFDPESVAARLRLQDIFWARVAEDQAIDQIDAASTTIGPDITLIIGFTRMFLQTLNTAAAGIRYRERMAPDAMLDVLAPSWFIQAMQDDTSFEQPGAQQERLATTQAQIEDWLRVRNIRIGWFLDGTNVGAAWAAQSAGANLTDYPQQPKVFIFEPGHHLFLDGGELNLGIIRDSTLNNTNEYQTFYETFEAVASRGVVSYDIAVNVCRTGTTGAAAEITCGEVS